MMPVAEKDKQCLFSGGLFIALGGSAMAKFETLFRVSEVAHLLGLHEMTVRRYIRAGQLKAERVSTRSIRVSESALNTFLETIRKKPPNNIPSR